MVGACNLAYFYTVRRGLRYGYYACSNNDIVVYSSALREFMWWLRRLEGVFPDGFIAAPILVNGYDGGLDFGGYYIDPWGGAWPLRLVVRSAGKLVRFMARVPLPVSYADGAFIVFHHRLARRGLFDPRYFLYSEDVEASLRAWSLGAPSFLVPVVLGRHYRSSSAGRAKPLQIYMQVRNRVYTVYRYLGIRGLVAVLAWYASYPFRLIDARDPAVRSLLEEVGLSVVASPERHGGRVLMARLVTRSVVDAVRWARRDKAEKEATQHIPLIDMPFGSVASMKAVLRTVQHRLRDILVQHMRRRGSS